MASNKLKMKSEYKCKKIGGYDIFTRSSIFSHNGIYLLTPSENCVRVYTVATGQHLFTINFNVKEKDEIISLQLHPIYLFSQIIVFFSSGHFFIYDYIDRLQLKEVNFNSKKNYFARIIYINHLNKYRLYTLNDRKAYVQYFEFKSSKNSSSSTPTTALDELTKEANVCHSLPVQKSLGENGISFGNHNTFIVTIVKSELYAVKIEDKKTEANERGRRKHLIDEINQFRCVCAASETDYVAVADTLGRIHLYKGNLYEKSNPIRTIMHWHSAEITSLCFSPLNSYLYSCGYEGALVRWPIIDTKECNIIPRLGFPLKKIIIDREQKNIAVSRFDNSIIFIGSTFNGPTQIIEGLSFGFSDDILETSDEKFIKNKKSLPVSGLHWDTNSESIVLNGRNGHLQFYSPYLEKQLFQLDITNQNYLLVHHNLEKIYRIEVTHVAISLDGKWMATVELRDDKKNSIELRLKFWKFSQTNARCELNSTLHLPHKKKVNQIRFSPNNDFLVTTSEDCEFKFWYLYDENEVSKTNEKTIVVDDDYEKLKNQQYWVYGKCESLNAYKEPKCIAISNDTSLVVISFENFLTIWDNCDLNKLTYLEALRIKTNDKHENDEIKKVEFASKHRSHYLIAMKRNCLTCWNVINLNVLWTWSPSEENSIEHFAIDHVTNNIVLFTSHYNVHLLNVDGENLFSPIELNKSSKIISAIFIPRKVYSNSDEIFKCTMLCFMNNDQEIFTLIKKSCDEDDEEKEKSISNKLRLADEYVNKSPLASLLSRQKADHLIKGFSEVDLDYDEISDLLARENDCKKIIEDMFINVPSHVLPPIERISRNVLKSLLIKKDVQKDEEKTFNEKNDIEMKSMSDDDDNDDIKIDDITVVENKIDKKAKFDISENDKSNLLSTFDENYSWLKV